MNIRTNEKGKQIKFNQAHLISEITGELFTPLFLFNLDLVSQD